MANMAGRQINAISSVMKAFQIRAVRKMVFTFDPYRSDARSIRDCAFALHSPKVLETNLACAPKINIKSDASDPEMKVEFVDDHTVLFKTKNLTALEVLLKLRHLCIEKDPKRIETKGIVTKSARKSTKK